MFEIGTNLFFIALHADLWLENLDDLKKVESLIFRMQEWSYTRGRKLGYAISVTNIKDNGTKEIFYLRERNCKMIFYETISIL